jgi:hypothetical protein
MDEYPQLIQRRNIGINLSAGTDSAFLMYSTLKKIQQDNLDSAVIPITGVDIRRPTNEWHAREIVLYFKEQFPDVKILQHQFNYYDKEHEKDKPNKHKEHEKKLFSEKTIDVLFHGVTANPDKQSMIDMGFYENRETKRDSKNSKFVSHANQSHTGDLYRDNFMWYAPFAFLNKKFIAEEYRKNGLMEELFPMTASCIGYAKHTNFWSEPCKECWWCKEKKWAFGMYDGGCV